MDTKVNKKKNKCARLRRSRGILISLCFVAAIVLAVGSGVLNQRTAEVQTASDAGQTTNFTEEAVEINAAQKQEEAFEVVSDPTYGEYEKGKVLLLVDNATNVEAVNAVLENTDFVGTKNVSDQDISAGFVQVDIDDSANMGQALEALEAAGLKAQPNFVYHALESEDSAAGIESIATAESVNEPVALEDVDEGSVESPDSTGSLYEVSTKTAATETPENDLDIAMQLFAAASMGTIDSAATINDPFWDILNRDEDQTHRWMLESVNAYHAWDIVKGQDASNNGNRPVAIAIVDTGCLFSHIDLQENIIDWYNSDTGQTAQSAANDVNGHGTHVAGIAAAQANNDRGMAGVSYNAKLVIVKASKGNTKDFSTETLARAYAWIDSNANKDNIRVVNMSVGGAGNINMNANSADHLLYEWITKVKEDDASTNRKSILTVCAAGNSSDGKAFNCIPGDYADCLTVINLAQDGRDENASDPARIYRVVRSFGSNYNIESKDDASTDQVLSHAKNISAPGTGIYSTTNDGSYGLMSGTSMASPLVAGVAALLFTYDPSLSATKAREILEQTATDIGEPGWDRETGHGEVNAYHALQVLSAQIAMVDTMKTGDEANLALCSADNSKMEASDWAWESSDSSVLSVNADTGTITAASEGTATLTATHKAISSRSITKGFTVCTIDTNSDSIDLKDTIIQLDPSYPYTGPKVEPDVKVVSQDGKTTFIKDIDYELTYAKNDSVRNDASVTITPKDGGRLVGDPREREFSIVATDITTLAIPQKTSVSYADRENASFLIRQGDYNLRKGVDYIVTYDVSDDPVLDSPATVTGINNYSGSCKVLISVIESFDNVQVGNLTDSYVYTGSDITPIPSLVWHDKPLPNGEYTLKYDNNVNVSYNKNGEIAAGATVTVSGANAYKSGHPQTRSFKITPRPLTDSDIFISYVENQVYYGSPVKPSVTVTRKVGPNSEITLVEGKDYTVSYENNTGLTEGDKTAKVVITGKGNYSGTMYRSFKINRISLKSATATVNYYEKEKSYNGKAQYPDNIEVKLGNTVLKKDTDYTVKYREAVSYKFVTEPKGDSAKNVEYHLVIEGRGKYEGTLDNHYVFIIYAPGKNPSGSSSNNSSSSNNNNNSSSNSSNANNNSSSNTSSNSTSTAASQSAPSAPTVTGKWVKSGSRWWFKLDSKSQSALKISKNYPYNRWVTIGGKRYYFDSAGWMKTNWLQWNKNWYWLGSDGAMKTGWIKTGGKWYYLLSNGIMQKGWLTVSGTKYYLSSSGAMLTGWQKISGTWYYFTGSGSMKKGWQKSGGKWYHLNNSSGAMDVNWFTDTDGKKYFLYAATGAMLTGWISIDGTWYYFNGSGVMQKNKWIGNYYVDGNGKMLKSQWVGKYWVGSDGKWTGKTR